MKYGEPPFREITFLSEEQRRLEREKKKVLAETSFALWSVNLLIVVIRSIKKSYVRESFNAFFVAWLSLKDDSMIWKTPKYDNIKRYKNNFFKKQKLSKK